MNDVVNEVVAAVDVVAPNSEAVQIAEAAVKTVADPSASNILNDVELAIGLVKQLKAILSSSHPSVSSLVKKLLF